MKSPIGHNAMKRKRQILLKHDLLSLHNSMKRKTHTAINDGFSSAVDSVLFIIIQTTPAKEPQKYDWKAVSLDSKCVS